MNRTFNRVIVTMTLFTMILPGLIPMFLFAPTTGAMTMEMVDNTSLSVSSHVMTSKDIEKIRSSIGVRQDGINYNVMIDGKGTGLAPPTSAEWDNMIGSVVVTDNVVSPLLTAGSSYDISAQPYFPIVGNQGGQGSCAAWAMTYYDYGYLEAKDNDWTDASTGNPAHLMSPAWTYNMVNNGIDGGSFIDANAAVITTWGVSSLATKPYVVSDYGSWGSEAAFREAVQHRALSYSYLNYNSANGDATIASIKTLIASDSPVTFALDANQFSKGLDGNYVIAASEYTSASYNHAQTIVGYDDSKTDPSHPDVGAFKIVNSWGTSFGDKGYYWITYDTFKKIGVSGLLFCTYITDRIDYQPTLLAAIHFNTAPSRDSSVTVGVGAVGSTTRSTPYFFLNNAVATFTFPKFMLLDITKLQTTYASGVTSFYLTIGTTKTIGEISSFRIEQYQNGYGSAATQVSGQSSNVPLANPCSVIVSMPSYTATSTAVALDVPELTFTHTGTKWSGITRDSQYGGSSLQSGDIGDGSKSSVQTSVTGSGTSSFWWKTSTQSTDKVNFYFDSTLAASASGVNDWTQVNFDLASGTHILKWEYVKDLSTSIGQDLVLLDHLQIGSSSAITVPGVPTSITAIASVSSITVGWTAPSSNGGSAITGYNIYRGTSSGAETLLAAASSIAVSYIDPTVLSGTTYYYVVKAVNSVGISSASNEVSGQVITVPSAPTGLSATQTLGKVSLTWTAPASNGGSGVTSYSVYRGTSSLLTDQTLMGTVIANKYDDTSITIGTTYYYTVKANNIAGSSAASGSISVLVMSLPGMPESISAIGSDGKVDLSWTAPTNTGQSSITGYKVYRSLVSGPKSLHATLGPVLSYADNGLTNGNTYYYQISAVNVMGEGALSTEVSSTPSTVPNAPVISSVIGSNGIAVVSWSVPSNGGSLITGYAVYRGTSSTFTSAMLLSSSFTGTTYEDPSLSLGITYYYFVTATNVKGTSIASAPVSIILTSVPSEPSSLHASLGTDRISINWVAPSVIGSSAIIGYNVYRHETSGPDALIANLGNVLTYDDMSVTIGHSYHYSVAAVNSDGIGTRSAEMISTFAQVPSATILTSVTGSIGTATLAWTAPTNNGGSSITGYLIRMWIEGGTPVMIAQVGPTATTFTASGLTNGITHWFSVTAMNVVGEGASSNSMNVVPGTVPGIPSSLSVKGGDGIVTVSWTAPSSNGGISEYRYLVWRTSNGATQLFADLTSSTLSIIDSTVTAGTTYAYSVQAKNIIGAGTSTASTTIVAGKLPTAPQNLLASAGTSSVQLSWSAPSYDGSVGITSYKVYRNDGSGMMLLNVMTGAQYDHTDASVAKGVTYSYWISACNSIGEGPMSATSNCIIAALMPGSFSLTTSVGDKSAVLSWTMPSNDGSPILRFDVLRTSSGIEKVIASVSGSSSQYSDSTVVAGTDYSYRVIAVNEVGSTSTGTSTVHAVYFVNLSLQTTTTNKGLQISGYVTMSSTGKAIGGQTVVIYHSIGTTVNWVQVAQLTTAANGKYSMTIKEPTGSTILVKAVLLSNTYHLSASQETNLMTLVKGDGVTANDVSSGALITGTYDPNAEEMNVTNASIGPEIVQNVTASIAQSNQNWFIMWSVLGLFIALGGLVCSAYYVRTRRNKA